MSFEWFFSDHFTVMTIRIVISVILSGLIGFERELKKHSAGFRTHILVGVGSCLMMLLSLYGFEPYLDNHESIRFDPARIPSYVISGIGFLGAGTIMVHGLTIRGLTTAASIWTVAGIGLIVGAGMYGPAIFTTFVVLLSLVFLNHFERFLNWKHKDSFLTINLSGQSYSSQVLDLLNEKNVIIKRLEINHISNNESAMYIELKKDNRIRLSVLVEELSVLEGVTRIVNH